MAVDMMSQPPAPNSGDTPNTDGKPTDQVDPVVVDGGDKGEKQGDQAGAGDRPADLPEAFWDATAKAPKWSDLKTTLEEHATLKAKADEEANKPAPKPEDYKVGFSEAALTELFGGTAPELDMESPLVKGLPDWAARNRVSQEAMSELVDNFGRFVIGEENAIEDMLRGEITKLGTNGPVRVAAIKSTIEAATTPERAEALLVNLGRSSSGALEAIEDLIKKAAGLSSPPPAGPTDEDLAKLKSVDRVAAIYERNAAKPKGSRKA